MADQDFNFNPPPRREAKKAFEPPPWEKEQFEELARRKEAERIAEMALTGAVAEQMPAAPTQPDVQPRADEARIGPVSTPEPKPVAQEGAGVVEDSRIEAMLSGLKREEPPFGEEIWKVSVAAGAILTAIGVVLVVWGVVAVAATREAGVTGSLGGSILTVFGLMFVGVGAWMVFKTLRQQGVL